MSDPSEPTTSAAPPSCAEDSPARTSAQPEAAAVSTPNGPGFGGSTPESFASYDPTSSSWRTAQLSLVEGLGEYSGSWPRSGTMRSGIAYRRRPSAPLTRGTASGLLPTPTASEYGSSQNGINGIGGENERPSAGTLSLFTMAARGILPTPTRGDAKSSGSRIGNPETEAHPGLSLTDVVVRGHILPTPLARYGSTKAGSRSQRGKRAQGGPSLPELLLPTPRERDWKGKGKGKDCLATAVVPTAEGGSDLSAAPGQSLHPLFVEWMMGAPASFTDLESDDAETNCALLPSETPSSPRLSPASDVESMRSSPSEDFESASRDPTDPKSVVDSGER